MKSKLNTSMFDELETKNTFEKIIESVSKDLGELQDKLAIKIVPQLARDITWLKRNLIITQICFGVCIVVLIIFSVLK